MAGIVYLRTNKFEVKLEGIAFKAKDFGTLCTLESLFPDGKIWANPPIVGIDIMRHPRDPSIILLLLCIGVGCVILRFRAGESLPESIQKFLTDERIRFVGYGIPEKKELFPFEVLGLTKEKTDIGYLAAKHLNNQKYKKTELGKLAHKVLGIKSMIGLTDASSFERHEQLKCSICQLFITSVIGMAFLNKQNTNKIEDASPKKSSDSPNKSSFDSPKTSSSDSPKKNKFLKSLNSMPSLEGWFKLRKGKKGNKKDKNKDDVNNYDYVDDSDVKIKSTEYPISKVDESNGKEGLYVDLFDDKFITDFLRNNKEVDCYVEDDNGKGNSSSGDESSKDEAYSLGKTIKGILKCPSTKGMDVIKPDSPPPQAANELSACRSLRRANSKGCNVSFK